MRLFALGISVIAVLGLAGCATTLSQKYAEPVTNTEKQVLTGMVQQLQSAAGLYAAQSQSTPQGFHNFVASGAATTGACRTSSGETADCTLSLANFNTVAGRSCQVSAREIRCAGAFRFYDPVVYTWNGTGQVTLQATPLNDAEPIP